jgi:retinol dehydrogenase-14
MTEKTMTEKTMAGKTVLVTGGTGGIGKATALGLARLGADVAITGRDPARADQAARELRTVGVRVTVLLADMSSQAEVRRLADQVQQQLPRLDVLINNVGGYWNRRHLTVDGLERTFAVNHLAPFLLTQLLLPQLRRRDHARGVTVASHAHRQGRIDFEDLQGEHSYSGARAYNQSKLANVLFTHELARRLRGGTVTINAVHPGVVSTSFGAEDPGITQRLLVPLLRPLMKDADHGAATSVYVASASHLHDVTGTYFRASKARTPSAQSRDQGTARRLWQASAALVDARPTNLRPVPR